MLPGRTLFAIGSLIRWKSGNEILKDCEAQRHERMLIQTSSLRQRLQARRVFGDDDPFSSLTLPQDKPFDSLALAQDKRPLDPRRSFALQRRSHAN